jgi:hypothetical protein
MSNYNVLRKGLPKKYSEQVTVEIEKLISDMAVDTKMDRDMVTTNIMDFIPAISNIQNVSLKKYMQALRFVFVKRNCDTPTEAWKIVFPDKYQELVDDGRPNDARSSASNYNSTKLVSALDAATMVAFSIQYAHFRHSAMQKEFELMNGKASASKVPRYEKTEEGRLVLADGHKVHQTDKYGELMFDEVFQVVTPLVQHQAALSILEITRPAEENDLNITVGISDEAVEQNKRIADSIEEVARIQSEMLKAGHNIDSVQQIGGIIEAKLVMGNDN